MKSELEKVKEEFASRLNLAMDEQGYPVRGRARVLSKEFGVSDKGAGKWINGEAIPETSKIPLIAAFLGINAEWLLSGVGEMRPLSQTQSMGNMTQSQGGEWQNQNQQNQPSKPLSELIETLKALDSKNELSSELINTLRSMVGVATSSNKDK